MIVDVLVIGGGIQGLVALRALTDAGYDCVLVTDDLLGAGQTLHAHGLLDSGTGLVTGETRRELQDHVLPDLRRLGVPVVEDAPSYLALPTPAIEQLRPAWAAHGHHPTPVEEHVPGLRLPGPLHRVTAHHVSKPGLVSGLAAGLLDRVVRGRVVSLDETCAVERFGDDGVLEVSVRCVVLAAGCGTPRLVADALGPATPVLARLGHVRSHMICLRAPSGVLPRIGTVVAPGLAIVGHDDGSGTTRWYVTPQVGQPERVAQAPDDASADVDDAAVAAATERLRELVPALASRNPQVEMTVYAGYKQDVDGQTTRRLVDVVATDPLTLVAVPAIYAGAWPNARDIVDNVRTLGPPRPRATSGPVPGGGISVGEDNELRPGVQWSTWADAGTA